MNTLGKIMARTALLGLVVLGVLGYVLYRTHAHAPPRKPYPFTEMVLAPGATVTATTPAGTLRIKAVDELTRIYAWTGGVRTIRLAPRTERWMGSLGGYMPAPVRWPGRRIVEESLDEGRLNYASAEEAVTWLRRNYQMVWRDDGLAVRWESYDTALSLAVWQILVNGKKPEHLEGSQNDRIQSTGTLYPAGG